MAEKKCFHFDCDEMTLVEVVTHYANGTDSRTAYCLDHLGGHVTAMFAVGGAVSVALLRKD
jgi:hypothetical protein